jgi:uncharacterized protein YkwD
MRVGQRLIARIRNLDLPPGSELRFRLSGRGLSADDFRSGRKQGRITINRRGRAKISLRLNDDSPFTGEERFRMRLFRRSGGRGELASSSLIKIQANPEAGPVTNPRPTAQESDGALTQTTQVETIRRETVQSPQVLEAGTRVDGVLGSADNPALFNINPKEGDDFHLSLTATTDNAFPIVEIVDDAQQVVEPAKIFNATTAQTVMQIGGSAVTPLYAKATSQSESTVGFNHKLKNLGSIDDIIAGTIRLTNQARAEYNLDPLTGNPLLHQAAGAHTNDMVSTGRYLGHTGSDGSTAQDRIDRVGYAWRQLAENAAAGQYSPAEVVEGWMNTPGHRANILNPKLEEIGIGFSLDTNGGTYWIQKLGTPL